jgi:hypothetical protein
MSMLSAIARSNGIEAVPGGKTLWCELMPGDAGRTWLDDRTDDDISDGVPKRQSSPPSAASQPPPEPAEPVGGHARPAEEHLMPGHLDQVA